MQGHPNRWMDKSVHGIFGALFFGAGLCAWIVGIAALTWYGSRASVQRRTVLAVVIGVEYLIAVAFSLFGVMFVVYLPPWVFAAGLPLIIIVFVIWAVSKGNEPGEPPPATPIECWRAGGMFYVNPADPVLFAERRDGLGYTFNFGNRWSWIVLIAMIATMGGGVALLVRSMH